MVVASMADMPCVAVGTHVLLEYGRNHGRTGITSIKYEDYC